LTDLDIMLRYFGRTEPAFWEQLVPRAARLELTRPLFYAIRFTTRLTKTPVPTEVLASVGRFAPWWPVRQLMDHLAVRALIPELRDGESWSRTAARVLLYLRSHWLRMPPSLLARHLCYKLFYGKSRKPNG
jgi:hypothetical protein